MKSIEKEEVFDAPIESVFKVLADYESYPEYMDGVSKVEVIEGKGAKVQARYDINIFKKFSYVLELKKKKNKSVSWDLVEGDIFSKNTGSWQLTDLGDDQTQVNYNVEVDFKVKIPGMIAKKLVSSGLPKLMKSVEKRAKNL